MLRLAGENAGVLLHFPIPRLATLRKICEFAGVWINFLSWNESGGLLYLDSPWSFGRNFCRRKIYQIGNGSSRRLRIAFLCGFFECFVNPAHLLLFRILTAPNSCAKALAIFPEDLRIQNMSMCQNVKARNARQYRQLEAKLHVALRIKRLVGQSQHVKYAQRKR